MQAVCLALLDTAKTVQKAKDDFLSAIDETKASYGSSIPNFLKDNFEIEYENDASNISN